MVEREMETCYMYKSSPVNSETEREIKVSATCTNRPRLIARQRDCKVTTVDYIALQK